MIIISKKLLFTHCAGLSTQEGCQDLNCLREKKRDIHHEHG
jgi:hypothetical protein